MWMEVLFCASCQYSVSSPKPRSLWNKHSSAPGFISHLPIFLQSILPKAAHFWVIFCDFYWDVLQQSLRKRNRLSSRHRELYCCLFQQSTHTKIMFPPLQPFFQEMSARWIIIADSMPRRAPLKKKIAAASTAFIKYYCCSLEEQEDPLPKKK